MLRRVVVIRTRIVSERELLGRHAMAEVRRLFPNPPALVVVLVADTVPKEQRADLVSRMVRGVTKRLVGNDVEAEVVPESRIVSG